MLESCWCTTSLLLPNWKWCHHLITEFGEFYCIAPDMISLPVCARSNIMCWHYPCPPVACKGMQGPVGNPKEQSGLPHKHKICKGYSLLDIIARDRELHNELVFIHYRVYWLGLGSYPVLDVTQTHVSGGFSLILGWAVPTLDQQCSAHGKGALRSHFPNPNRLLCGLKQDLTQA